MTFYILKPLQEYSLKGSSGTQSFGIWMVVALLGQHFLFNASFGDLGQKKSLVLAFLPSSSPLKVAPLGTSLVSFFPLTEAYWQE